MRLDHPDLGYNRALWDVVTYAGCAGFGRSQRRVAQQDKASRHFYRSLLLYVVDQRRWSSACAAGLVPLRRARVPAVVCRALLLACLPVRNGHSPLHKL